MKFNCGEKSESKIARLSDWHLFFALIPRTISEKNGTYQCVWLETIERKGTFFKGRGNCFWLWEYRQKNHK